MFGENAHPHLLLRGLDISRKLDVFNVFDVVEGKCHEPIYHNSLTRSGEGILPWISVRAVDRVAKVQLKVTIGAEVRQVTTKAGGYVL